MPGILPMKVIKVGTSAQARIAQACDRCRSKKIRCDGVRPCCSQCAGVGFECKTSDKLSRRAFPRGYTESLEERVRSLELEVRELKALLDEKDEKIDMLTKIHPRHSSPMQLPSPRRSSATSSNAPSDKACEPPAPKEETFKVQQSPYLSGDGAANSYFAGTSGGKTFLDSFKQKIQERGRSAADIKAECLLSTARQQPTKLETSAASTQHAAPPRLVSDQMVNIFFQEWAPLFPIVHRPTFLTLYEKYTSAPESVTDKAELAQLHLVFGLAALSNSCQQPPDLALFESQWQAATKSIQTEQTISTLQVLVLAQLYCIQRGDYNKLLTYKALAISISSRLGLHQSQKRFPLGTLSCETRKKVFWTLYTIDSFSAVLLGLPKQIKDDDVHCEYPVDADDEYVTERGFQPLLPGESTRLSSALALFRASRILSKVLEEVYPALPSYELSLQKLSALSEELDQWLASLPQHLRLQFAQDKPSVGTVSSRSPLLSLTYHYIRSLIHRPAVCSSLGSRSASSLMAMAGSCKHVVQIIQLLVERGLSFSFCLNKEELLVLSGFGLLYQGLDLEDGSKILKDNQRMLAITIGQLDKIKAPAAMEFRRVACSFLPVPTSRPASIRPSAPSRHNSDGSMPVPHTSIIAPALKQQFKAMTSKFLSPSMRSSASNNNSRRATEPTITPYRQEMPAQSLPNLSPCQTANIARSEPARSPQNMLNQTIPTIRPSAPPASNRRTITPNLDYLSFSNESTPPPQDFQQAYATSAPVKAEPTDWERLLGSIDNGQTNIFDNIYGGPPVDLIHENTSMPLLPHKASQSSFADDSSSLNWGPDFWAMAATDLVSAESMPSVSESGHSFDTDEILAPALSTMSEQDCASLMSSTDLANVDAYRGIVMPALGADDGFGNWENVFAV